MLERAQSKMILNTQAIFLATRGSWTQYSVKEETKERGSSFDDKTNNCRSPFIKNSFAIIIYTLSIKLPPYEFIWKNYHSQIILQVEPPAAALSLLGQLNLEAITSDL